MRAFKLEEQAPSPPGRDTARVPARIGPRMEHRFGRRYSCGEGVRVAAGEGVAGIGRFLNVSMSGAYIESALDFPHFALVSITRSPVDGAAVELRASVVRRDAGGFAVEWCETPAGSICHLLGCSTPCHP
jgi:hypothetical protein